MPLPSVTKTETREIQTETITETNELSCRVETNLEKAPPVVNIYVYVPSVPNTSIESNQVQPTIHLHFNGQIKLSSGSTSENNKMIETISGNNLTPNVISKKHSSKKQSNSHEEKILTPLRKNRRCKKLSLSGGNKNCKNLRTDESESVLNSVEISKVTRRCQNNKCSKEQLPLRRSIRQANNKKLLKTLEEINVNKSSTKKTKNKDLTNEIKSGFLGNALNIKQPVVVLHDIQKIIKKENLTFSDAMIGDNETECVDFINSVAEETDGLEKNQNNSNGVVTESEDTQNVEGLINEGDKMDLTQHSDENATVDATVDATLTDAYPLEYPSEDNEATIADNEVINFNDKSTFLQSTGEDSEEKSFYKNLLDTFCGKSKFDNENSLESQEYINTTLKENEISEFVLQGVDQPSSIKLNNSSDVSVHSYDVEDLKLDYDLPPLNFEIDDCESVSVKETHVEKVQISIKSNSTSSNNNNNNNILKNIIEENEILMEKNDNWGIHVHTPTFQLELIKKEMKKRNMIISRRKTKINRKHSKMKESSKVSPKEKANNSSVKDVKAPRIYDKKKDLVTNTEECTSAENFIRLEASGPTRFSVGQISNIKPYLNHKARNFKNEVLFGERVRRYKDPKQHQINLLKLEAAKKRFK